MIIKFTFLLARRCAGLAPSLKRLFGWYVQNPTAHFVDILRLSPWIKTTMTSKIAILLLISAFIYQKISSLLIPHSFISSRYNLLSCYRQLRSTLQKTKYQSERGRYSVQTSSRLLLGTISSYDAAMSIIDKCSTSSQPCDELCDAVRCIDKNAKDIYPNLETKEEMWFTTFKPVPIFAYARIDESTFGNGVGVNENLILLSLLGPLDFDAKKRQMNKYITWFCSEWY